MASVCAHLAHTAVPFSKETAARSHSLGAASRAGSRCGETWVLLYTFFLHPSIPTTPPGFRLSAVM